jgi:hypothetical protein
MHNVAFIFLLKHQLNAQLKLLKENKKRVSAAKKISMNQKLKIQQLQQQLQQLMKIEEKLNQHQ